MIKIGSLSLIIHDRTTVLSTFCPYRIGYILTYLSHEGREVLMLKNDGKNFFGESVLVRNVKCSSRIGPGYHRFILLTLCAVPLNLLFLH